MAENDIKTKIVLEGEKEYKQALKDANRELKTLRSELKAETAELGKNATEQQKNAVKVKNLQKQIQEQEKVVKTYTKALEEVKNKYGDNEDEVAKWEQKLNSARATLANMKNDLDGVGDSMKGMANDANMATVATKSAADAIGRLGEIGGSISDTIGDIFTGTVSLVRDTITEIWADVVDLAARSNNLVDLAGFWNTDVTKIQKYAGAITEISGDLEDLNSLVTKINAADAKKVAELTGVSDANYKDRWEYAMAVMEAMSDLGENRNNAAFEIFGTKQATKAFDLLNDWDKMLAKLDKYDVMKDGYGLSEEQLQTMSDLYDKVNGLKQSWQSLKDMATVKLFGSLSMDLTSNAQGVLDGFLDYLNADNDEERDAAIKKVEDNILDMFRRVKQAIEDGIKMLDQIAEDFKASDDPALQTVGKIMGGLVDALEWFTEDNMHNVVTALEILAAFWIAGKGFQMATTIAEFVKNLAVIKGLGGLGAAGAASGAGAGAAGAGAAGGGGSWIAGALGFALKKALPVAMGAGWVIKDSLNNHGDENSWTEEEIAAVAKANHWDPWQNQLEYGTAQVYATDKQRQAAEEFWDVYRQNPTDFSDEAWDAFEAAFVGQEELFDKINDMMDELTQADRPDDWWTIEDLPANWWLHGNDNNDGITNENLSRFNSLPSEMKKAVKEGVSGIRVNLDGRAVGALVAEYVSAAIAENIQ